MHMYMYAIPKEDLTFLIFKSKNYGTKLYFQFNKLKLKLAEPEICKNHLKLTFLSEVHFTCNFPPPIENTSLARWYICTCM